MSVPREPAPGRLGWQGSTEFERFLLREVARYRRALIRIEKQSPYIVPAAVAATALDKGEDAALAGEGSQLY